MPENVARRVNAERLVLLGWARAILLQLAHPLIAAGVHDHSSFRATPLAAVARLHGTVRAMLGLTFGSDAERARVVEGILSIHRRVNGQLPVAVGPFAAGTYYTAEDPALVQWVHVTLLDSVPLVYSLLVAPLSEADRDAYCADAASIAIALGAREEEVPRTWSDAQAQLQRMYSSGMLAVSGQARELGLAVVAPPVGRLLPGGSLNRIVTLGLLPPDLRTQYGFAWTERDQRRFERMIRLLRAVRRVLPDRLAHWRDAR